jgi:hypothetical protein
MNESPNEPMNERSLVKAKRFRLRLPFTCYVALVSVAIITPSNICIQAIHCAHFTIRNPRPRLAPTSTGNASAVPSPKKFVMNATEHISSAFALPLWLEVRRVLFRTR